jgi:hypothetical protein
VNGHGEGNTRAFHLLAGNYTSDWIVTGDCFQVGRLVSLEGRSVGPSNIVLPSEIYRSAASGQTQLYGVPEGNYYVSAGGTACDWLVTLTPLR